MLEVVEDLPERLVVAVVAIASVIRCWRCGAKTNRVHATKVVRVLDLPHGGRPTTLLWHRRRFRCPSCRATTTETHPFLSEAMTTRLARAVVADCADMTVSAVARRYGLRWHRVMALCWPTARTRRLSSKPWRTSPRPTQEADGVELKRAITTFSRWGNESLAFHLAGRVTNAGAEGVNGKIECLERMAYGFRNRPNYEARVLLFCCGHPAPVT